VTQALIARVDADLAKARLRRDELEWSWAHSMYTAGCRGRRSPKELDVELAQVTTNIAELEERRAALVGTSAVPDVPPMSP
jgi:hypothetical protein